METVPRRLEYYQTSSGSAPCLEWLRRLRDARTRYRLHIRIQELEKGNFGNCRPVGEGVHEQAHDFGPGYRIYFGNDGDVVVLLAGGDKATQSADIRKAKEYWKDYNA